jgi:hypothetical protein
MNFVWDLGGGRLLLSAAADLASATTALVDAATRRTIGRPFGGEQSFAAGAAGSLLLLRTSRSPVSRTVMTRLDLADGMQTVLGARGSPTRTARARAATCCAAGRTR